MLWCRRVQFKSSRNSQMGHLAGRWRSTRQAQLTARALKEQSSQWSGLMPTQFVKVVDVEEILGGATAVNWEIDLGCRKQTRFTAVGQEHVLAQEKRVDEVDDEIKTREKSARRVVMKHFQMEYSSKDEPAKRREQRKSNQMMQRERE